MVMGLGCVEGVKFFYEFNMEELKKKTGTWIVLLGGAFLYMMWIAPMLASDYPLTVNQTHTLYEGTVIGCEQQSDGNGFFNATYDIVINEKNTQTQMIFEEVIAENNSNEGDKVVICDFDAMSSLVIKVNGKETIYNWCVDYQVGYIERALLFLGTFIFFILEIQCLRKEYKKEGLSLREKVFWNLWIWGMIAFYAVLFFSVFPSNRVKLLSDIVGHFFRIYIIGKIFYNMDKRGLLKFIKDEAIGFVKPMPDSAKASQAYTLSPMSLSSSQEYRQYLFSATVTLAIILDIIGAVLFLIGKILIASIWLGGIPKKIVIVLSVMLMFYATVIFLPKKYLKIRKWKQIRILASNM